MNDSTADEMERTVAFRASAPFPSEARLAVGRARLVAAAATEQTDPRRRPAARRFPRLSPMVALAAAVAVAAVAAGTGYTLTAHASRTQAQSKPTAANPVMPTGQATHSVQQATLAAKILHAAAVRLAREAASAEPAPGQWIFYEDVDEGYGNSVPAPTDPEWVTFDGGQTAYYDGPGANAPLVVHTNLTSFPPPGTSPWAALADYGISPKIAWDALASLPADPQALLTVIASQVATPNGRAFASASVMNLGGGARPATEAQLEFDFLTRLLWNAQNGLGGPPAAEAAVYQAMAALPGISVQQGITDAAGAPAIAISDNGYSQLLLSPATDQVVGLRVISDGIGPRPARRGRPGTPYPPEGAVLLSTATLQVTAVAAPGDR